MFKVPFVEMYVNMCFFVIRCWYSAVSLTLVREQHFIRMINYYINVNMIFYTHVEHSPTKTIHIKYYTKTKTHYKHTHTLGTHTHTHTEDSFSLVLMSTASVFRYINCTKGASWN